MEIHFETRHKRKEVLRLVTRKFNGHTFTEARVYYQDKNGQLRPGKSGFTLPKGKALADFAEALCRFVKG